MSKYRISCLKGKYKTYYTIEKYNSLGFWYNPYYHFELGNIGLFDTLLEAERELKIILKYE